MGGPTTSSRRRHHLPDDLEGPGPNSLYPSSVPFQSQTMGANSPDAMNSSASPYQDMYYNSSPTHPPKRSQTQHDSSTSSRSGRSPMRQGNLSTPALLDSYASQQSQYSPTSAAGYYPDPQRPYGSSAHRSHSRSKSNTDPLAADNSPPYPAQYAASSHSPNPPPAASPAHLTTQRSGARQNSASMPSTPLSFSQANPLQEGTKHYYPQEAQPMMVEPAKRRASGFHRVRDHHDLHPVTNRSVTGRRMDSQGLYLTVSFSMPIADVYLNWVSLAN